MLDKFRTKSLEQGLRDRSKKLIEIQTENERLGQRLIEISQKPGPLSLLNKVS